MLNGDWKPVLRSVRGVHDISSVEDVVCHQTHSCNTNRSSKCLAERYTAQTERHVSVLML